MVGGDDSRSKCASTSHQVCIHITHEYMLECLNVVKTLLIFRPTTEKSEFTWQASLRWTALLTHTKACPLYSSPGVGCGWDLSLFTFLDLSCLWGLCVRPWEGPSISHLVQSPWSCPWLGTFSFLTLLSCPHTSPNGCSLLFGTPSLLCKMTHLYFEVTRCYFKD